MQDGILVRAVLAPHHGKDAEFGEIGHSAQQLLDLFKFVGGEAEAFGGFDGDVHAVKEARL